MMRFPFADLSVDYRDYIPWTTRSQRAATHLPWTGRVTAWRMPDMRLPSVQVFHWSPPWIARPEPRARTWTSLLPLRASLPRPSFPISIRRPSNFELQVQEKRWASDDLLPFGLGLLCGAAMIYLLDPEMGNSRRKLLANRSAGLTRRGLRRAQHFGLRASSDIAGKWQAMIHTRAAQQIIDDTTLKQRIESILFRDPDLPKGDININCEEGTAVLRGALSNPAWISIIEERVRAIDGVLDVRNLLHPAGTPAP